MSIMTEIQQRLKSMRSDEVARFLADNAGNVLDGQVYRRNLTETEITKANEDFIQKSIVLAAETEAFDEIKAEFMSKKKLSVKELSILMTKVRHGFEERKGKLFYFDDQIEGTMEVYDEQGNLVESRKLRPNERQSNINTMKIASNE